MFCRSCGKEIPEGTSFCPHCGASQAVPTAPAQSVPATADDEDKASIGLIILSFLIPLAGWILYFVKKEAKPVAAKTYANWAWGGFGANLLITIINM